MEVRRRHQGERPPAHERALVVDDSIGLAEMLARVLGGAGIPAVHATFGALSAPAARASEPPPTVLVVDGDGHPDEVFERCRVVRGHAPGARLLLLVDADDDRVRADLARRAGAHACVSRRRGARSLVAAVRGAGRLAASHAVVGTHGTRRGDASAQHLADLTPREREVLRALLAGLRDPEIAALLAISPHTVRTHLQHAFAKLGVHTRHEAAVVALQAGLPPLDTTPGALAPLR
jgi:DNA-binding NarL/FixJ family response regulator